MGLGYQWSLDFATPLSLTPQHNRYVLVMVEHFSKWLELVPLSNCSNEGASYAFLDKVFSRFGALVKVFTDLNTKFCGEFQKLCEKANKLVEQMVQTMKQGLQKYGLHKGHTQNWDLHLPWLTMGYKLSGQASFSSFSPYFLLFSHEPELPTLIQRDVMAIINFNDLNVWIQACEQ
jgi:hypothetical protein